MIATVDLKEFLEGFLVEAGELMRAITAQLSIIETAPDKPNPRAVRELFRALHTLKGLAGMMGVEPVVTLTHSMESVVRSADRAGGTLAPTAIDPLAAGVKAVEQRVRALADGSPIANAPDELLEALEQLASRGEERAAAHTAVGLKIDPTLAAKLSAAENAELAQALNRGETPYSLEFTPTAENAANGVNITSVRERVASLGRIVRVLPMSVPRSDRAPGALTFLLLIVSNASAVDLAKTAGVAASVVTPLLRSDPLPASTLSADEELDEQADKRGVVRVNVERLDDTLEHLAAVGVCGTRLLEEAAMLASRNADVRALLNVLHDHTRQLRRLRASILELRMVELREVLEPLPLIVRGLRNTSGKAVRLHVSVGRAELDKTVADRVFPALVHLVRNAVDHGIEAPSERASLGKPEQGTISVEALARSSSHLEITITDDGAGIDVGRVLAKSQSPAPSNDDELLEILTRPGFSTRDRATATSGRGFGLDIVRQSIELLGGELSLVNHPGKGSSFRLRVPLTVAIVDAFAFEAGAQKFLVPVPMVDEICELDPADMVAPPGASGPNAVRMFERRGETIPVVSLGHVLGNAAESTTETRAIVVRRQGTPYAFSIGRVLGKHEVLVRPLLDPFVRVPGVAGSADIGDGTPTLVMDLFALSAVIRASSSLEARS